VKLPLHTRLILASKDLLETWGARTKEGWKITAEWGDMKPEGWYEPTFTKTNDGHVLVTVDSLARALHEAQPHWQRHKTTFEDHREGHLRDAGAILDVVQELAASVGHMTLCDCPNDDCEDGHVCGGAA
jgi:hypothetical protein